MTDSLNRKRQIQQLGLIQEDLNPYKTIVRNNTLEEVAERIEQMKGFGPDTISSFAIYIRNMKNEML
jgi:hypothetical protein